MARRPRPPHTSHPQPHPEPIPGPLLGPVFDEPVPGSDPANFGTPHESDGAIYAQISALLKTQTVAFPRSRVADDALITLNEIYGPSGAGVIATIQAAGRLTFHSVGDTGASDVRKYRDEIRVADQLTTDSQTTETANRAAFLLHLGDVVYSFGESRYYYDQFYEPYRAYPAPILAIAGNHDSFVIPGTAPADEPLAIFTRDFCAERPVITPEAGSLHRTAMTLPGVYFALDLPFARIIGLFSNALEDPGVISSEGGRWPGVPDTQLTFLEAQLKKIRDENYQGAVIIATHHPAFTYSPPPAAGMQSANHSGSSDMLRDIDTVCAKIGVYPHAFLSAHAHCYQRYTCTVSMNGLTLDVPFVVCGNGGHNVNPLVRTTRNGTAREPENGTDMSYLERDPAVDATGLLLEKYDDHNYGYLRVTVDTQQLRIAYHQAGVRSLLQSRYDLVTLDLKTRQLVAN